MADARDPALDDGSYDVIVVDATIEHPAGGAGERVVHLDLTVLSGPRKGEVVRIAAAGLSGEEHELLGLPGTLRVTDGRPEVQLEP